MTVAQLRKALRGLRGDAAVVYSIYSTMIHGMDTECPLVGAGLAEHCPGHEQTKLHNFQSHVEVGITVGRVVALRLSSGSRSVWENAVDTWAGIE